MLPKLLNPYRSSFYRRLIALVVATLLVSAQQGSFAHYLTHLAFAGGPTQLAQTVAADDTAAQIAAEEQGHVCTTCLALDAFSAALPVVLPILQADTPSYLFTLFVPQQISRPGFARYQARAPPSLQ